MAIAALDGAYLVVEEKLDGANAGLVFGADRELRLQSRGHYLTGGYRERPFDLFKSWAATHAAALWDLLGARFVVYGEWLFAKHTVSMIACRTTSSSSTCSTESAGRCAPNW